MTNGKESLLRLGVNLDHIASLRQARFTLYPDLSEAVWLVREAGADGLTLHLREDRRHVQDADLRMAKAQAGIPLNMEMAATDEMLKIAIELKPHACCLVPEKREELTTEGGLDVLAYEGRLRDYCAALAEAGIRVSLFVEPEIGHLDAASRIGAPVVELHTGAYANAAGARRPDELERIRQAAEHAAELGLEVHAGHGLDYENVGAVAAIACMQELNIGHSIVSRSIFVGLAQAIREMRRCMGLPAADG